MEFDELNIMKQIGLAFISGFTAGTSFMKAEEEAETEEIENEGKHSKYSKEADVKIEVGKLEGDAAKKFMNMIEKMTKGDK